MPARAKNETSRLARHVTSSLPPPCRRTKGFGSLPRHGTTASGNPDITSDPTLDVAGRVTSAKDRRQVDVATLGSTLAAYDEFGRTTSVPSAPARSSGSSLRA